MNAPPLKPSTANCLRKRRYADELSTRAGAQRSLRSMQQDEIWIYQCRECRGWHITSRPQGRRWRVTAEFMVDDGVVA